MLALLSMTVLRAWADSTFGGGDGSVKNPYIINTAAHWNQFASDVNGGNTYSDKYFLLDVDITVTTMVGAGSTGKNAKPFSGTFDGGGHTLTFTHTATAEEGDVAPFRFIRNATICNLHVAGEIITAYKHAGGLAGRTYGTTVIRNCRVSTVIRSSVSGDGTHGGIVALKPDWSSAHLTIEGCVYDGKIVTTNGTTLCGGFVGYTSYGSLTIKNSIYAPQTDANAVNDGATFYRFNGSHTGTITSTNCYYTQTLGTAQGKQAHSIGFPFEVDITVVPTGNATEYSVSGITGYEGNQCVKYNGTVYAGNEDVVRLTFTHNYVGCNVKDYKVESGGAGMTGNNTDGYTLSMADADVIFGFSMTGPALAQIEGNGTPASPYIINTADAWEYIVSLVNYGQKYVSGKDDHNNDIYSEYATAYYKLTDNITVTMMMGSENHRFKGHFDGYGHTLTVNYNTDEQYTAPFRYVEDAEIRNLRVAGTIATSKKFAAGFVANAQGNNTMINCRSSVTINSSVNGDGSHGGFVAHNMSGQFTMKGCAFDGSMLGNSTNKCGGFVGWNETNGSPEGVVYFENCFFAPTSITVDLEHTYARSRINDGAHVQMFYSNCRTNFGDNQQFRVYSISAGDGVTIATTQSAVNTYSVSGVTIYNTGMMFDGVLYARDTQIMSLNLSYSGAGTLTGYTSTAGLLSGDSNPFTFTMGTADAVINATLSEASSAWSGSGAGTSGNPYIISNSDDWNEFAYKVNNGVFGFNTAYYRLAAGITVTKMVGTDGHKFKGHFDGGNKTLTLSYGSAQTPFIEDYCAPFRYIEGAEISNLTVAGTIYTQKKFAAGIVGYALNNNAITDCRSSVTINSSVSGDGTHGGFVANCQNNDDGETFVAFTRCAFNGQLLGTSTNNCGGFVGWTEGNDWAGVKIVDCIFAPSEVSVQTNGSATFSRGRYNNLSDYVIIENSYYTQRLGTMQGEMGYTEQPADVTTEALTIAGITIYVKKIVVTDVTATNITPTTATISWTGSDACSNYQVRYRVKPDNNTLYSTSFEEGLPVGWTTFNNDDDEHNWTHEDATKKGMAHSGNGSMYSASYINNYGSLEPDNWLVSKQLKLGGTMKVWLKGQDEDEYREHFAIYLSTTGGSKSDFLNTDGSLKNGVVTLVPETETTNEYQEYTASLSAYSGQTGYIAIRHFNCYDEFNLVLDDFSLYNENAGGTWTTVSGDSPAGTSLGGLTASTTYEYQVEFKYGNNTYYTPTLTLTTLAADVAPTNLSVAAITPTTATISWTGYGESYNLLYGQVANAKVTLYVPDDIWEDGSGYQMLLDADHNTYGSVIPESSGLTTSGDASAETYAEFEYKIPENADGALDTQNAVDGVKVKEITITIPAGVYDWCITNPSPNDRVWISSVNGNVGGRQNDFSFEAGKHYTFTVTFDDGGSGNDCVNMTVGADNELATASMTEVKNITSPSYSLSGLTASTDYVVYVQSVKGGNTSEWSSINFTTRLYLYDDQDNNAVLTTYNGQTVNVTLQDRTLYKDGKWNTLCLPFNLELEGSPLAGADVRALDNANLTAGTLTLNFTNSITKLVAGTPYIIKWASGDNIVNPVFNNVTIDIDNTDPNSTSTDGKVEFRGTYASHSFTNENRSILFLGSDNTLYWPQAGARIGAQRAYFELDPSASVRAFNLNFGDEATGIHEMAAGNSRKTATGWYTLDGMRREGKPSVRGIYIHNGQKIVIK